MEGLEGLQGLARIGKIGKKGGVPLSGIFPSLGFLNPSLSRIDDIGRIQGIGRIGKDWQE